MPEIATQSCLSDVATSTPSSPNQPGPTTDSDQPMKRVVLADRYKTKLCDKWVEKGKCPYDRKCMFAHGEHELRTYEMNLMDDLTTEENIRQFRRNQRLEYQRCYYENYCLPDMMETMSLPPQYYQGAPPPPPHTTSQLPVEQAAVLAAPTVAVETSTPPAKKNNKNKNNKQSSSASSSANGSMTTIPAPRSAQQRGGSGGKNSSLTSDPTSSSCPHETSSRAGTVEYNSNCGDSEHEHDYDAHEQQQQQYQGEHLYQQQQPYNYNQYGGGYYNYSYDEASRYWYQQQQMSTSQDGSVYYYHQQSGFYNYDQQEAPSNPGPYRSSSDVKSPPHAPSAVDQTSSMGAGSVVHSEGEFDEEGDEASAVVHKRAGSRTSSTGSMYRYNPYGASAVDAKYLSHKRGSQLRDPRESSSVHP